MKAALKVGGANTLNIYTVGYIHKPQIFAHTTLN